MAFRQSRIALNSLRNGMARSAGSPIARSRITPYLALTVAVGAVWYSVSHDERTRLLDQLRSPWMIHADSAPSDLRQDPKSGPAIRVDQETSMPFPQLLKLSSTSSPLTLIGLGPRKVSFLRVKVYSAGFYLEESALEGLSEVPGWHTFTAQHLLTPPTASSGNTAASPQLSGEALMRNLFDRPIECAVRIVPVKNTDFGHLRDGFTRALLARQKLGRSNGTLTEADEETVPKGKSLVLVRPKEGGLVVEYDDKVLGRVDDPWIGKEMMLAYFADKNVISDALKEDVAKGFEGFFKPLGPRGAGWS